MSIGNEWGCPKRITRIISCAGQQCRAAMTVQKKGRFPKHRWSGAASRTEGVLPKHASSRRSAGPGCSLPIQKGRAGIRTRSIDRAHKHVINATPIARRERNFRFVIFDWLERYRTNRKYLGKWSYPRFCFTPSSVSMRTHRWCLDWLAPAQPHCDRTDIAASPPALLSVGHSPSRRHLCRRWWAFTPPVRPLPVWARTSHCPNRREYFLLQLSSDSIPTLPGGEENAICPDLLFRQATLHHLADDAESREVPLATAVYALASDGTPACQNFFLQ